MARGRKTGGRDFRPGIVTNPHGRPRNPPELKDIRKMTRVEVEHKIMELWDKNESEIASLVNLPTTNMRDKTIMRVMLRSIAKGDHLALGFIMDLIFGKRAEKIDLMMRPFKDLSDEELDKELESETTTS